MIVEFHLSLAFRVVYANERVLDSAGNIYVVSLRPLAYDHAKYLYLDNGSVVGKSVFCWKKKVVHYLCMSDFILMQLTLS